MTYTPINWQTGDTITADKLNRCDNGWGYESTQLFSETVTTVAGGMGNSASLSYASLIDVNTITVAFSGTDYECNRIIFGDNLFYGGFSIDPAGPDFTDYPFFIMSTGDRNTLYTETAGTYTVAVVADAIVVSDNFKSAVMLASQDIPSDSFEIVKNVTTWEEARDALLDGKHVFLISPGSNTYQSQAVFASPVNYSVGFIEITGVGSSTPTIAWLRASSSDGVLTDN